MLKNGFIKLYRSLLNWEWYDDINTKTLFIHLLLTVSISDDKWHGQVIKRGSRIVSVEKLSQETGLTIRNVRTALKHLKSTNEVTSQKIAGSTIITVKNFNKFQEVTNKVTNDCQTGDKEVTNECQQYKKNKEDKEDKEEREGASAPLTLGDYQNVFLTSLEKKKLVDEFGEELAQAKIERLSEYMATSGKSYPNHYARVRSFCKQDKKEFEETKSKKEEVASYDLADFEKMAMKTTPKGASMND